MQDGANYQARAVLAFLQALCHFVEESDFKKVIGNSLYVARWENCREQGYVVSLTVRGEPFKQLNIAFFEHRNSDSICAVRWEQSLMNSPTIDTAKFGDVYKDKYDTSHAVSYGNAYEMAEWIANDLDAYFWSSITKKETLP
tara:strand:+ start:3674 stop:4099 length:426 start_codon:yes stop_codon:yes gene_type:complete